MYIYNLNTKTELSKLSAQCKVYNICKHKLKSRCRPKYTY